LESPAGTFLGTSWLTEKNADERDIALMTLVAAYRELGTPVIVGDFLLSDETPETGLTKKIHRLQPNLAVGWTGSFVAAGIVLRSLYRRCLQRPLLVKRDLEDFLQSFPVKVLGKLAVTLVGWIVDDKGEHCFLWRSDWPQDVFYADHQFVGSGEAVFERLAGRGSDANAPGPKDVATRLILSVSVLLNDEIGERKNRANRFGHAYEVLIFDGGEFRYLDDVLFVFVDVELDVDGRYIGGRFNPMLYKCHHLSDCAIVEIRDMANEINDVELHVITPTYGVADSRWKVEIIAEAVPGSDYVLSPLARHWCLFAGISKLNASGPSLRISPLICVTDSTAAKKHFDVTWEPSDPQRPLAGKFAIRLPSREIFEEIYRHEMSGQEPADQYVIW
jgi:hypothetical protein